MTLSTSLTLALAFAGVYALYRFLWAALERWLPATKEEDE